MRRRCSRHEPSCRTPSERPSGGKSFPISQLCRAAADLCPVNAWITNLRTQRDYATVGQNLISVTNAETFCVDGYFEETQLDRIHGGDPTEMKLMRYRRALHGHVDSVARAINVRTQNLTGEVLRRPPESNMPAGTARLERAGIQPR